MNENDNDLYFKDCFTEQDGKINAEFNRATIKCLNSVNNNFSLDCDGNLSVNSITTKVLNDQGSGISFDDIYPIGSYYETSNDSFNPNTAWGGTWILDSAGRVTVAKDAAQNEFNTTGQTGGSKYLQEHFHFGIYSENGSERKGGWGTGNHTGIISEMASNNFDTLVTGKVNNNVSTGNSGNLQPYVVVNRWHRIG